VSEECQRRLACFGGWVSVHVGGSDRGLSAEDAVAHAEAQLSDIHFRLSRFIEGSELSQLNLDPRETVPASLLMRRFAAAVVGAGNRSAGLVDATRLGPLERLGYRQSREGVAPVPLSVALDRAPRRRPAKPDPAHAWRTIRVDETAGTVSRSPGVRLDSGGIAKGLAADLVAAGLRGHPTYAVDCAGDMSIGGAAGVARRVEVADPFGGECLHELELVEGAVATSGIGRRSWLRTDGAAAHHLLDPSTGEPAYTGVVQATAFAPTAVLAETLAKVAVLSGPEHAPNRLPHGGVIVHEDGSAEVVAARVALSTASLVAPANQVG
jgi:thiamine biosynthesis lipoprotein